MMFLYLTHHEDKEKIIRPLANALVRKGLDVWYDGFTLRIGDSLRLADLDQIKTLATASSQRLGLSNTK